MLLSWSALLVAIHALCARGGSFLDPKIRGSNFPDVRQGPYGSAIKAQDETVWREMSHEYARQRKTVNLIASENYVSSAVLEVP